MPHALRAQKKKHSQESPRGESWLFYFGAGKATTRGASQVGQYGA